jgi:hypothetical protein
MGLIDTQFCYNVTCQIFFKGLEMREQKLEPDVEAKVAIGHGFCVVIPGLIESAPQLAREASNARKAVSLLPVVAMI